MVSDYQIPEPFIFNPLKHHLDFIREYINLKADRSGMENSYLIKELKRLGSSVMDVYTGSIPIINICNQLEEFLNRKEILSKEEFSLWAGTNMNDFRVISINDGSQWTLKYHANEKRFVHFFPARNSQHSFRVKANTLKSAIIYNITVGKDFITGDDLNSARTLLGLSPVKNTLDTEAITEMIEILRVPV